MALDFNSYNNHDDNDDDGNDNEETEEPAHGNLSTQPTYSIAMKLAYLHTNVNALTICFEATSFIPTLSTYTYHLIPSPAFPILPNLIDQFDIYKQVTIL